MRRKKGLIPLSYIMLAFGVVFLSLFTYAVYKLGQTHEHLLTFREVEILTVKNTFYLAKESLDKTWSLSTVQNIFEAFENGLGHEYWYQGTEFRPTKEVMEEYIRRNMKTFFSIKRYMIVNGVNVTIGKITLKNMTFSDSDMFVSLEYELSVHTSGTDVTKIFEFNKSVSVRLDELRKAGLCVLDHRGDVGSMKSCANDCVDINIDEEEEYYEVNIAEKEARYNYIGKDGSIRKKPFTLKFKIEE